MHGSEHFTRLAAMLVVAALLSFLIARPNVGPGAIGDIASLAPAPTPLSEVSCPIGKPPLTGPFAPIEDVISVSPLGGVTAPGEPAPAPYIRINTRAGGDVFERRRIDALAPGRVDVVAIERLREPSGDKMKTSWTVHFVACKDVRFYYARLDEIDARLLERVGGPAAFTEIGGPQRLAIATAIRLSEGERVGASAGFDVGLHDRAAPALKLARPERYAANPYIEADVYDAPPALIAAVTNDLVHARCPLDYLPGGLRENWAGKLGDAYGLRKARGDDACRTALIDAPGTAQGAWYTDSSHNAATKKVSRIALAPDTIDRTRQIFALHGRVKSLTPDFVALPPMMEEQRIAASRDFLSFSGELSGRVNTAFSFVEPGDIYCYERLRANFVGPLINGVLLLEVEEPRDGVALLKIEARQGVASCAAVEEPIAFSGAETTFYR